ncbi:hypothetical protein KPH14_009396 [Odynerus spinipes]|uniref:Uncharacterized protein n=1 Tax=Odynerus spinipes TaxID=1348599 RepID=A0AAD9RPD6_9HYME|nr:hypothetical protein KPH14_009396 [Odynerus spinipes]
MFSFLCILLGLFQFAFLLLVTGILLSIAIVSRLMEIVVTLIHPTTVFLLRQSVKLFVLMTTLLAKTTGCVLYKIIERLREDFPGDKRSFRREGILDINMRPPPVTYSRTVDSDESHPYARPLVLAVDDEEQAATNEDGPRA